LSFDKASDSTESSCP